VNEQDTQATIRRVEPDADLSSDPHYGEFVLEPLQRGFGQTVGNAMRRVLLSSLPGSAISSVRIDGVTHEFSTVPSVKEDVTQIVLNLKRVRVRSFSSEPVTARLTAHGPGVVTAEHVSWPESVEIVNGDQVIATLDSEQAQLSMDLMIKKGWGFVEGHPREDAPIGEIPVDQIYTPIRKVEFHVSPARIGGNVDRDRLNLRVWTDGTVTPEGAVVDAARILVRQFHVFQQLSPALPEIEPFAKVEQVPAVVPIGNIPAEYADVSVDDLELSNRTLNCLKRNGITRLEQLAAMTRDDLLHLRNFGDKSLEELEERLGERGIHPWGVPSASTEAMAEA
jgi:DNA-directed RNA polymerase subunit alpha